MYALTLAERADRRAQWLTRGFRKMHARRRDALFDYWKRRLANDVGAQQLADQVWAQYLARHEPQRNESFTKSGSLARPGDLLAWIIRKVTGVQPGPYCSCRQRQQQMNEWGWKGCFTNRSTILAWIADEAGKRGHVVGRAAALDLLRSAVRELNAQRLR
jgi:hypothetical protein